MDFKTRDLYRKEIEILSFASGQEENDWLKSSSTWPGESNRSEPGSLGMSNRNQTGMKDSGKLTHI